MGIRNGSRNLRRVGVNFNEGAFVTPDAYKACLVFVESTEEAYARAVGKESEDFNERKVILAGSSNDDRHPVEISTDLENGLYQFKFEVKEVEQKPEPEAEPAVEKTSKTPTKAADKKQ